MKEVFKPNLVKTILFIILVVVSFCLLNGLRIFPCQTQPVIQNPPPLEDSLCLPPLLGTILIGVNVAYSPVSYVLVAVLFVVVPYVLACLIGHPLRRKKQGKQPAGRKSGSSA
jgi:succinate dehydrogenase/fumarate reductase cytochrome b subunit